MGWFFLLFLYLWAASQACRFFLDARRSGLIELLIVSPVTGKEIVRGQCRAIIRMFGVPVLMLVAICATATGLSQATWQRMAATMPTATTTVTTSAGGTTNSVTTTSVVVAVGPGGGVGAVGSGTNSGSGTTISSGAAPTAWSPLYYALVPVAGLIGAVTILGNLIALFWFGMWMGMTSKNANTATAKTILFVHVIPWMCITFASGMIVSMVMMGLVFKSGSAPSFQFMIWYPLITIALTGVLTVAKDIVFFVWARRKLYGSFREQAIRSISPALPVPPVVLPNVPEPPVKA
jgi:hypothetical protein